MIIYYYHVIITQILPILPFLYWHSLHMAESARSKPALQLVNSHTLNHIKKTIKKSTKIIKNYQNHLIKSHNKYNQITRIYTTYIHNIYTHFITHYLSHFHYKTSLYNPSYNYFILVNTKYIQKYQHYTNIKTTLKSILQH